jgi:ribosome modulation factor
MHAREDFSNVLIEDTPVPLVAEPVSRTAYQLGYAAKVGDVNPFKIVCQRGDWNEGFLDMKNGRPRQTGCYYGK